MERSKNAIRVARFKAKNGYEKEKNKYHILRKKYGIPSAKANEMKYWGRDKIVDYLVSNKIRPIVVDNDD